MRAIARWLIPLLISGFVLAVPQSSFGDPHRETAAADKRAKVKGRLKQIRAQMLRKRVGLDEATAARVEAVFESHKQERNQQQQRLRNNRKAIMDLVKSDSNDQAAYARAIAEERGAEQALARIRNAQTDELAKILTPKQQAKLTLALRQLQKRLRNALKREGDAPTGKADP